MNDREAAFIERMAAAATHEIMNGLASIGQATGLMSDLLALGLMGGRGGFLRYLGLGKKKGGKNNLVKFRNSIANVSSGLDKSFETTKALNGFIHSITPSNDSARAEDILEVLTILMRRPAKQQKVELRKGTCAPGLSVHGPRLTIYRALASCLDELLGKVDAGAVIEMSCRFEFDQAVFSVTSSAFKQSDENSDIMKDLLQEMAKNNLFLQSIEYGYAISVPHSHA